MSISALLTDIKTAWVTTVATATTGTATAIEMIPSNIGKLGTLVGIVLSIVLIYTHVRAAFTNHKKDRLGIEKAELEIEALKRKARRSEQKEDLADS
jgi:hypothetical protein